MILRLTCTTKSCMSRAATTLRICLALILFCVLPYGCKKENESLVELSKTSESIQTANDEKGKSLGTPPPKKIVTVFLKPSTGEHYSVADEFLAIEGYVGTAMDSSEVLSTKQSFFVEGKWIYVDVNDIIRVRMEDQKNKNKGSGLLNNE